ncbi:MAG TPA: hypothetical protein DCM38_01365 [Gammaproteobacteria bacterium]|nr:hypothetical protein [Gammaproteobacteria bacterium]
MAPHTMIPKQEIYPIRLKPFVERKIASNPIYLEKFNQEGWIEYLAKTMAGIPLEQFLRIADEDLKGRIGRLMSLQLVAGMLNDFTPEQMKTFDDCMIRR